MDLPPLFDYHTLDELTPTLEEKDYFQTFNHDFNNSPAPHSHLPSVSQALIDEVRLTFANLSSPPPPTSSVRNPSHSHIAYHQFRLALPALSTPAPHPNALGSTINIEAEYFPRVMATAAPIGLGISGFSRADGLGVVGLRRHQDMV